VARLHAMVTEAMRDRESFARWFGQCSTAPKYPDIDWRQEEPVGGAALRERLAAGVPLRRNPASRFSFIRQAGGPLLLFVDGEVFECGEESADLAERICAQDRVNVGPGLFESEEATALIEALLNRGGLAFDENNGA
jgi:50S ribosomal protein L16 3-hydroxylase